MGTLAAGALVSALVMVGLPGTAALYAADYPHSVSIAAGRIFRGERTTPAFAVDDVSSGTSTNRSSGTAFASDGMYFTSRAWDAAFAAGRYLDVDLNQPLPAGLSVSSASLTLRIASAAGTGSVCVYVELYRASNSAAVSSHGSSGSPLACTSGSTYSSVDIPVAAVSDTDLANDMRVRIFGRDSAGGALRLDQAILVGETPYTTFALYPTVTHESYGGLTETIPWGLAQ